MEIKSAYEMMCFLEKVRDGKCPGCVSVTFAMGLHDAVTLFLRVPSSDFVYIVFPVIVLYPYAKGINS
jgi:hypothetical protein